jgi:hypothetical protein
MALAGIDTELWDALAHVPRGFVVSVAVGSTVALVACLQSGRIRRSAANFSQKEQLNVSSASLMRSLPVCGFRRCFGQISDVGSLRNPVAERFGIRGIQM